MRLGQDFQIWWDLGLLYMAYIKHAMSYYTAFKCIDIKYRNDVALLNISGPCFVSMLMRPCLFSAEQLRELNKFLSVCVSLSSHVSVFPSFPGLLLERLMQRKDVQ